jgi:hypothetical protein
MKKYYDLPESKLVACLDWNKGYGTLEQAQEYFKTEVREITLKEFNEIGEKYSKGKYN